MSSKLSIGFLSACLIFNAAPAWAGSVESNNTPFTKAGRGAINTITGWVEIPKRIQEEWDVSGPAMGFTWGLVKGFGYGFVRTAAGLYELVTFPFPAPPGFEPVIQPEFVFDDDSGTSSYDHP